MRLTRVLLPTFGRPTTATTGRHLQPAGIARASRSAVRPSVPARSPLRGEGRPATSRRGTARRRGRRRAAGSGGRRVGRPGPRARSAPASRPATAMLPPKKSLAYRDDPGARAARPAGRAPGRRTSPVTTATERVGRGSRVTLPGPAGAPGSRPPGRRRRDRKKPPVPTAAAASLRPEKRGLEGGRHADAVLVLGQALVGLQRGERAAGEQVVLVGREDHPAAERAEEDRAATPRPGQTTAAASSACGPAWRPRSCSG